MCASRSRADYIVRDLEVVQNKNGDGYLGALEGGREAFAALSKGDIRSGGFDLNGLWSPWYTLHKTFAGLRDAYRYAGNRTALAIEVKYAGVGGAACSHRSMMRRSRKCSTPSTAA